MSIYFETIPKTAEVPHLPYLDGEIEDYISRQGLFKICGMVMNAANPSGVSEKKYLGELAKSLKDKNLSQIADFAKHGNIYAKKVFEEFGRHMGKALSPILNDFGAQALVIGGRISATYDLFIESLLAELKKEKCEIDVFKSELGDFAPLYGAAYLRLANGRKPFE